MNKILLIIKREYLSRVKKKSFVLMTVLGPVLIGLFYGLVFYFALNPTAGSDAKKIAVYNLNDSLFHAFESDAQIKFEYLDVKQPLPSGVAPTCDGMLVIPLLDAELNPKNIELRCLKKPGLGVVKEIQRQLENMLTDAKLKKNGLITQKEFEKYHSAVSLQLVNLTDANDNKGQDAAAGVGIASAFLIYIFIFLYGVQVMRGVIEEKTNRIVEVIIASVKPFELMLGKIVGIALVGLTQFSVWLIFGLLIVGFGSHYIQTNEISGLHVSGLTTTADSNGYHGATAALMDINFPLVIGCFLFFFLTGYIFYGALFAGIGSAVDSETDTQQFMLPVTLPLVFGFIIATSSVVNDFNSPLAKWLSVIPFTAPVVTMVRVPFMSSFNVDILIAMVSMLVSIILVIWTAGKIYRTGILMYGKKVTYREIYRWLKYK